MPLLSLSVASTERVAITRMACDLFRSPLAQTAKVPVPEPQTRTVRRKGDAVREVAVGPHGDPGRQILSDLQDLLVCIDGRCTAFAGTILVDKHDPALVPVRASRRAGAAVAAGTDADRLAAPRGSERARLSEASSSLATARVLLAWSRVWNEGAASVPRIATIATVTISSSRLKPRTRQTALASQPASGAMWWIAACFGESFGSMWSRDRSVHPLLALRQCAFCQFK